MRERGFIDSIDSSRLEAIEVSEDEARLSNNCRERQAQGLLLNVAL